MTITRSFKTFAALLEWGRAPAPSPTGFFVGFSTGSTFTDSSSILDFLSTEVVGNGYARQPIAFASDGAYNPAQNRHEMPQATPQITAAGGSITFRTIFILYNARAESRVSFPGSAVDTGANTITVAGHGLANGEPIGFSDDGILGMIGGLAINTLYQAINVTANTFQVSSDGLTPIDLTSAGGGPYNLLYAKGGVRSFQIGAANKTIASGSTERVVFDAAVLEGTYV